MQHKVVGCRNHTQSGIIISRGLKICLEIDGMMVSSIERGAMNGQDQY